MLDDGESSLADGALWDDGHRARRLRRNFYVFATPLLAGFCLLGEVPFLVGGMKTWWLFALPFTGFVIAWVYGRIAIGRIGKMR